MTEKARLFKVLSSSENTLGSFLQSHPVESFRPLAYYDKQLDCIRVEIRDCSVTEIRLDYVFTILEDNYPEPDQEKYVGFTIKGVRHLFARLGIPLEGVLRITDLLAQIVAKCPQEVMTAALAQFEPMLRNTELKVDFAEAA